MHSTGHRLTHLQIKLEGLLAKVDTDVLVFAEEKQSWYRVLWQHKGGGGVTNSNRRHKEIHLMYRPRQVSAAAAAAALHAVWDHND
jgi:hypothetical protein